MVMNRATLTFERRASSPRPTQDKSLWRRRSETATKRERLRVKRSRFQTPGARNRRVAANGKTSGGTEETVVVFEKLKTRKPRSGGPDQGAARRGDPPPPLQLNIQGDKKKNSRFKREPLFQHTSPSFPEKRPDRKTGDASGKRGLNSVNAMSSATRTGSIVNTILEGVNKGVPYLGKKILSKWRLRFVEL